MIQSLNSPRDGLVATRSAMTAMTARMSVRMDGPHRWRPASHAARSWHHVGGCWSTDMAPQLPAGGEPALVWIIPLTGLVFAAGGYFVFMVADFNAMLRSLRYVA